MSDDTPTWKRDTAKPEPGDRPTGSPDDRSIFRADDVERAIIGPEELGRTMHAFIQGQAERDALMREGQAQKWLREHWPWYVRWAIGYPRAIAVLDRLGLVTMPVFAVGHMVGDSQLLKDSTTSSWTFQVYGYDVKVHARAWALGPDGQRIDLPLTPGMFDGHAVLILDPGPVAEAINEWELRGRS